MTSVAVTLWELEANEVRNLPEGFPILEYDTLYSSLRVITAKKEHIRADTRYVYLLYKKPPVNFVGTKERKRSRLAEAARTGTSNFVGAH